MLTQFTAPQNAWYPLVGLGDLPQVAAYLLGSLWFATYPVLLLSFWYLGRGTKSVETEDPAHAVTWTALASLFAIVAFVAIGAIRPSFTFRYMAPFAPGFLLGVILVVRFVARRERWVAYSTLVVLAGTLVANWLSQSTTERTRDSSPQLRTSVRKSDAVRCSPSRIFLGQSGGERPAERRGECGGRVLFPTRSRTGHDYASTHQADDDPNQMFLRAAAPGRAAVLWIYDLKTKGTAAIRYPPRITSLDPHYTCCRDFQAGHVGVMTCVDNRPAR